MCFWFAGVGECEGKHSGEQRAVGFAESDKTEQHHDCTVTGRVSQTTDVAGRCE